MRPAGDTGIHDHRVHEIASLIQRAARRFLPPGFSLSPARAEDDHWMREALALARTRHGHTWPNPTVGAVVVQNGTPVGRGVHLQPGSPHAEVVALQQAGERARGATLYVTLEPCCHYGRTPPCTDAILRSGVRRVVISIPDPHPRVQGGGLRRLAAAGLEITVGVEAVAAVEINEPFLHLAAARRPWVVYKYAASLDGKVATSTGDSRWISGPAARREVHRLRFLHPAIMVGRGTVAADDPLLTARRDDGTLLERQPVRVVVDSHARTDPGARMFSQPGTTVVACTEAAPSDRVEAFRRAGAEVEVLPATSEGRVDLAALMCRLAERELCGVLLEGGGTLAEAMLQSGFVDEVVVHMAPLLIGGDRAPGPVRGRGREALTAAWRLHDVEYRVLDDDLEVRGWLRALPERVARYYGLAT